MTKKKGNTTLIMQDIIDNQNEKIKMLESRIEVLKDQLETAYGVNAGLSEELDSDEKYTYLTKLQTLILVFMGLTRNYCKGSELGRCIENAIENYYLDMAEALARHTEFGFGKNKEDESTDEYDDEAFDDEEL